MSQKSPVERVRQEHGSKEELVEKILDVVDVPQDEDPLDFEERLSTASNSKLLRLWDYSQLIDEQFGSKQGLIDKIETAKFPGGNADYADKLAELSIPRLIGKARDEEVL